MASQTPPVPQAPMSFIDALNRSPMRTFQFVTVAICMLVLVCDGIDLQLLGIVAPLVMEDFGVDRSTFGIAMMTALIGFGIGSWGGGYLGDVIGRRYTLAIAALVFSLATIGAGGADGVWSMAFWRLIGGLGFGGAYANALAMAGEWLSDRWRPVVVSTLSVGTPVGGTIVGWLGPDLAAANGWGGAFVIFGLATMALVVVILVGMRDSPSYLLSRGKIDQARRNAALVLDDQVELVAETHDTDGKDGKSIGVLHASNKRMNIGIGVAFAGAAMVAYSILSWSTTFLTAAGFTLDDAGEAVAIGGITSMIGSILVGLLIRRFGSRIVMICLSVSLVGLMIALGLAVEALPAAPDAGERLLVVSLIGASGAVFSASIAGMYVVMTAGYPQSCRSAGIGFGIFMSRVGAVAATGLGGTLLQLGGQSVIPFFTVLTLSAILILAAAFVVDRHVPPLAQS
ncbi:MFS transporter [Alteraurantiacibacter aestuarii]|uniref:MFS transporter n=1 Tax=Alteraurantiacibacter aestuarii TaxID=650004 RepID=A0A844ZN07_9SPHN|nr:MFS transporter [Alteraurantiacibacter aestuarii]MXO89043.1 MFS transporter [Alteraurantiacibacter aestuarii]